MIIVDLEACGTNPYKSSLVSIGAVDFYNSDNRFYGECCVFEGAKIEEEAMKVHGMTKLEITDTRKKAHKILIKEFLLWTKSCQNRTLAGNNISFDRDFLRFPWIYRYKEKWPLGYRTVDLHSIAYSLFLKKRGSVPIKNHVSALGTTAIFKILGLPKEPEPHNALTGALMELEAFSRIINEKNILKEYKEYPIAKL